MFKPMFKGLGAVVLASMVLTGCAAAPTTAPTTKSWIASKATTSADTGSVKIAFPGFTGYKTLASASDIRLVRLTLSNRLPVRLTADQAREEIAPMPPLRPYYEQTVELSHKDLQKSTVFASFSKVPVGQVTLRVEAFDADKTSIGRGESKGDVKGGQETHMKMAVRLAPSSTGSVSASVTFLDGDDVSISRPLLTTEAE